MSTKFVINLTPRMTFPQLGGLKVKSEDVDISAEVIAVRVVNIIGSVARVEWRVTSDGAMADGAGFCDVDTVDGDDDTSIKSKAETKLIDEFKTYVL